MHYVIQFISQLSSKDFSIGTDNIPFFSEKTNTDKPSSQTEPPVMADTNDLKSLKLYKKYGMKLDNISSCPIFLPGTLEKDTRCKQPHAYNTSSSCMNGNCSMTVEFGDEIPESVALCVKQGDNCVLKHFNVPKNPEVVGYTASFELTPEIKSQLDIQSWEDEITFENANGHSLEDNIYTVSYESMPIEDNLMVNGQVKLKVKFKPVP